MTTAQARRLRWALAAGVAVVLVWGANFTVQKQVYQAMSVGGFLFARYAVLGVLAAALLCWHHGIRWPRLTRGEWRPMLMAAFVGQLLHVSLVSYGIHWSTAFSSSLILACGPVFTLLILRWTGHERLAGRQLAGVALACGGVLVFLSDKLLQAEWSASAGDLVVLAGAVLFSVYTVQSRPLFARHGSLVTVCYANLLAVVPMMLLGTPAALQLDWGGVGGLVWLGFFWSSVVVAFFGWMAWGWVNSVRGVARTAPLIYLMPPVAGFVSWWLAGEVFGPVKLAGAALALAGVVWAQWKQTPAAMAAN